MTPNPPGGGGTFHLIEFRRNDQDRRPPSRVLTPMLMGDPIPDRLAVAEAIRQSLGNVSPNGRGMARRDGPNTERKNKRGSRQKRGDEADG